MDFNASINASGTITSPRGEFEQLTVSGTPVPLEGGGGGGGTTVSGVIANRLDTTHSPVGLWLFKGNLNDSSGNGFDLDQNSTYVESSAGSIHPAAYASVSEAIEYHGSPAASLQITGDITVQMIVFLRTLPSVGGNRFRILRYQTSGETEATNGLYALNIFDDGQLEYDAEEGAGTNIEYASGTGHRIIEGRLYHLAFIRSSNQVTFFVNGQKFGDTSSGLNAPSGGSSSFLKVGGGGNDGEATIACVKIIDSALTESQLYDEFKQTWAVIQ